MQSFRHRRRWLQSTAVVSLAILEITAPKSALAAAETGAADAAASNTSQAGSGGAVQEVVVTARRREESLAKVPVAVTAFGASDLAARSITSDADLQRTVPGLTIRENFNANFIDYALRGQTVESFSGSRPAVVAYFNDVQTPQGASSAFYDLSSIQVLKGPQGTLFGRNATGGAVLYSTNMPKDQFGGYVTAGAGDYGMQEVHLAVDLPVVGDKLLVRIAGFEKSRDGYVDNVFTGEGLGAIREQSGRITIVAHPIDNLTISTVYQYGSNHGTDNDQELYSAYTPGQKNGSYTLANTLIDVYSPLLDSTIGVPGAWNAFLAAHPGVPAGGILQELALQKSWGPWKTSVDEPEGFTVYSTQVTNTVKYDITPDLTLKNIVGFGIQRTKMHSDIDGTPFPVLHNYDPITGESGVIFDTSDFSEEAQILGTAFNKSLRYIGGVYYSQESDNNRQNLVVVNLLPIAPPSNDTYAYRPYNQSEAVFFQATYDIGDWIKVDNLRFTAGARYTGDQNQLRETYGSILYVAGAPPEKESAAKPSWQFGLEYQPVPSLLLYVNQRGSWRGGGYNGSAPDLNATAAQEGNQFLPETTEDVEVGAKFNGFVLGRPTKLNLAFYDQIVHDVQRTGLVEGPTGFASVTTNVPSAEVTGIELEGGFSPMKVLRVGGSFAWTDARYTDGAVNLLGQILQFNSYPDTPRLTGDVFAEILLPLPAGRGAASIRGDIYAQSTEYLGSQNFSTEPETSLPGYHLINLHADWTNIMGSRYSVSLFATNVGNTRYYVGGQDDGESLGINTAVPGMPRMYGFSVTANF
jgi:iron complex outermembrane receptor protein